MLDTGYWILAQELDSVDTFAPYATVGILLRSTFYFILFALILNA